MTCMHMPYRLVRWPCTVLPAAATVAMLVASIACGRGAAPNSTLETPPVPMPAEAVPLATKIARFAPTDISANAASLPANEKQALDHLVMAAQLVDGLFLQQVWADNPATLVRLASDTSTLGKAELHYFLINKGPWSRLDHNENFLRAGAHVPPKPPQAPFQRGPFMRGRVLEHGHQHQRRA